MLYMQCCYCDTKSFLIHVEFISYHSPPVGQTVKIRDGRHKYGSFLVIYHVLRFGNYVWNVISAKWPSPDAFRHLFHQRFGECSFLDNSS